LPTDLASDVPQRRPKKTFAKPKEQVPRTTDDTVARKAARGFEREQRRRESQRRKEEAAREKQGQRRHHAIAKAQAAV
jgi:colicin import membrane protein